MSASGKAGWDTMFAPQVPGFPKAELDDLASVEALITDKTVGVMLEPVQGEGGVIPASREFMQGLRALTRKHGILLIVDEVQTGFGRTGKLFAHEYAAVKADIMVMAKGLGSGFPISGIASTNAIMSKWTPGSHGGTYGGNPMACAAAAATLAVIQTEGLVENAAERGRQLSDGLAEIQSRFPVLGDVRGLGLMMGCEFTDPASGAPAGAVAKAVVSGMLKQGKVIMLTCGAYGNVIRWIPPLVVSEAQINDGLLAFEQALQATQA